MRVGSLEGDFVASLDSGVHAQIERVVVILVLGADRCSVDGSSVIDKDGNSGCASGVPVFLVKVSDGLTSLSTESEISRELGGLSAEVHGGEDTLGEWHVGSGEGLDLVSLEGAILVPETFGAGSG